MLLRILIDNILLFKSFTPNSDRQSAAASNITVIRNEVREKRKTTLDTAPSSLGN